VSHPDLAREVFAADPSGFDTIPVVSDLFGLASVLATSGTVHKRQRKLLNPRFHGSRMKDPFGAMQRVVGARLEDFRAAAAAPDPIAMLDFAQWLTLDVILETTFGATDGLDREAARKLLRDLVHGLSPAFVFSASFRSPLFPPWRRFVRRRPAFNAWVDGIVASRRAAGVLGDDILGMLLEATYDDGQAMPDAEIRDQLMTLLLAGHETSAVPLAWGVYWLHREPLALGRVRNEVDALGPAPAPDAVVRLHTSGL
jgi:cytochrome P450